MTFRRYTLLPLDDCLYALQPGIPGLTRSNLHRCLQRHGISRLPEIEGDKPQKKKFQKYPIGYFHSDIAEVQTEEGKLYLFVAIDRTSKFASVELHERATRLIAREFLEHLIEAVPYKIRTILTDNGIQFAKREGAEEYAIIPFDRVCIAKNIDHRLTKIKHPWTNGQGERMNRTLKEATVKRYDYQTHEQLKSHMHGFLMAYNFARRLKTLKGLTPYEYVCKIWTTEPKRFNVDPNQHTVGLNIQELKETQYLKRLAIRTAKCLTNRIERDHRRIKHRRRAMQTFQVFRNAQGTIAGVELAYQFRKERRRAGSRDRSWVRPEIPG